MKGTVDASRDGTLSYPFSLPSKTNPGPVTIFQNADLSGFVAGNANFDRYSMTPAEAPWPSTPFFFYNDGEKVWMQFHRIDNNGKEAKWVVYEFRQSGNDITCKRLKGGYHGGTYSNKPANFTQYECFGYDVYHFGDGGGDYSCSNLTVTVKNMTDTTVAISSTATNNFASGVTVDGAVLAATAACALPQSAKPVRIANTTRDVPRQTIDVVNGGKLFLTSSAGNDNLGTSTVTLKGGSQIFFCRPNANGSTSKIVAEGGSEIVVECGMPLSRNNDNKDVFLRAKFNNALSNIVLKDGSTVRGSGHVRVGGEGGYVESSRFRVEGTVPSRIAHDIAIQRLKQRDQTPFYLPNTLSYCYQYQAL